MNCPNCDAEVQDVNEHSERGDFDVPTFKYWCTAKDWRTAYLELKQNTPAPLPELLLSDMDKRFANLKTGIKNLQQVADARLRHIEKQNEALQKRNAEITALERQLHPIVVMAQSDAQGQRTSRPDLTLDEIDALWATTRNRVWSIMAQSEVSTAVRSIVDSVPALTANLRANDRQIIELEKRNAMAADASQQTIYMFTTRNNELFDECNKLGESLEKISQLLKLPNEGGMAISDELKAIADKMTLGYPSAGNLRTLAARVKALEELMRSASEIAKPQS